MEGSACRGQLGCSGEHCTPHAANCAAYCGTCRVWSLWGMPSSIQAAATLKTTTATPHLHIKLISVIQRRPGAGRHQQHVAPQQCGFFRALYVFELYQPHLTGVRRPR